MTGPGYPKREPRPPAVRRMMDKELWGVFFDDQGDQTYLVAVFDDEEQATDYA